MRCELDSAQWFALQVRHGYEAAASDSLRFKGYQQFLPVRRRPAGGRDAAPRALFPGYVFCRLGTAVFGPVVTTPGVIRIVAFGGRPIPVPDDEIESIRQISDAGLAADPHAFLEAGRSVRVIRGPLAGARGILQAGGAGSQLVVSLSLLRRSVAVRVDPAWLEPEEDGLPERSRPSA